jgi:hypothetical protein
MLGYDASDDDVAALVAECAALCRGQDLAEDAPAVEAVGGVLRIFVDLCSLFRRQPADDEGEELGRLSTEEHLFTYLRDPGSRGVSLPEPFVAKLRAALAHYGVLALTPSPQLEESLYRIFKAHQREERLAWC